MYIHNDYVYPTLTAAKRDGLIPYQLTEDAADGYILFDGRHNLPELAPVYTDFASNPMDFDGLQAQAESTTASCGCAVTIR